MDCVSGESSTRGLCLQLIFDQWLVSMVNLPLVTCVSGGPLTGGQRLQWIFDLWLVFPVSPVDPPVEP